MSKLTNLKVLDLRETRVELHEEDIHMLQGLQALEPIRRVNRPSLVPHVPIRSTEEEIPWREIDLRDPSIAGYLVGKCIGVPELDYIRSLMFSKT